MLQATQPKAQEVARAYLPGAMVTFYDDGTATWAEATSYECGWCGSYNDLEGASITLAPDQAWHLLQAIRQHLASEAWRQAGKAIMAAISGPED